MVSSFVAEDAWGSDELRLRVRLVAQASAASSIMRERAGHTLPFVFKSEAESLPTLESRIDAGAIVHADEATHWTAYMHAS